MARRRSVDWPLHAHVPRARALLADGEEHARRDPRHRLLDLARPPRSLAALDARQPAHREVGSVRPWRVVARDVVPRSHRSLDRAQQDVHAGVVGHSCMRARRREDWSPHRAHAEGAAALGPQARDAPRRRPGEARHAPRELHERGDGRLLGERVGGALHERVAAAGSLRRHLRAGRRSQRADQLRSHPASALVLAVEGRHLERVDRQRRQPVPRAGEREAARHARAVDQGRLAVPARQVRRGRGRAGGRRSRSRRSSRSV